MASSERGQLAAGPLTREILDGLREVFPVRLDGQRRGVLFKRKVAQVVADLVVHGAKPWCKSIGVASNARLYFGKRTQV